MIDDRRFEALTDAVKELLRRQHDFEKRLARLEGPNPSEAPAAAEPPIARTFEPSVDETIAAVESLAPGPLLVPSPILANAIDPMEPTPAEIPRDQKPAIETKVGLTVVNRVGVITLILGVAFFFKWAVDNNWIGPVGRVLLGLLVGFAALGAADYLWRKAQQVFAQGVTGAGLAILYLSAYSAFGFYHLIPQSLAFAFLVSVTVLGVALSLRYGSAAIAVLGLFGGYSTPFLLSSGADHSIFLLSYILLLDLAAMMLARQRHWRSLEILSFLATTLVYCSWFFSSSRHSETTVAWVAALAYFALFAYAGSELLLFASTLVASLEILAVWDKAPGPFFALELVIAVAAITLSSSRKLPRALTAAFLSFWTCVGLFIVLGRPIQLGSQFAGISAGFLLFLLCKAFLDFRPGVERPVSVQSLSLLATNGSVYFGLAYFLLHEDYRNWLGLLAVGVAASYLGFAALLRRRSPDNLNLTSRPLQVAIGMAMAFVTLAIPIQLTGFRITIGWAIQAAALTWIGVKVKSQRALFSGALIFTFVAIRLVVFDSVLSDFDARSATLIFNGRFAVFTIAAACAFLACRWASTLSQRLALAEYLGAHLVLLTGLTLEVLLWAQRTAAPENMLSVETVSVSILFAVYALVLVGVGVATRTALHRIAGLALIGFVIVKLYLFDVWQLDRVYRIGAFVALGLLLISTSFLYSRFRPVIEKLLKSDETPA